jgi:hypothetical protein
MAITNDTSSGVGSGYSDVGTENGQSGGSGLKAEVKQQAAQLTSRARERATSGIEDTLSRAAGELHSVANALRQCGSDMNTDRDGVLTPYVEQVADQVNRLSGFLENRSVDDLAREVQGFARRNPAVFLGACFGIGVLAARFLKSSKPQLPAVYEADAFSSSQGMVDLDGRVHGEESYLEPRSTGNGNTGMI